MATVTGTNLLAQVLADTGATMPAAVQPIVAARLQQMIDAGIDQDIAFALVLSAASSEIRTAVPVLGDLTTIVGDAKTEIIGDDPVDPGVPGETFTLTPGTDEGPDFVGTDDNDVFNAGLSFVQDGGGASELQTLNNTDVLDGGDGVDRLNATINIDNIVGPPITGLTTPESIENIEQFYLTARAAAQTLDMTEVNGAEQVWNNNSTQDLTVSNLNDEVVLGVIKGNGKDYTVDYAAGTTSANFTQSVVLQEADITNLDVQDASGNITGLSVNVTGDDAEVTLAGDLTGITDLTIEGDAGLDVSAVTLGFLETLTSTTTGDVEVVAGNAVETVATGEGDDTLELGGSSIESVTTGAGDDDVTITSLLVADADIDLGAGDDRLDLGDNVNLAKTSGVLNTTVSLDGGAGMNTLAMGAFTADAVSTDVAGFDAMFENFQKLELGMVVNGDAYTVDLANMDDIDYVITDYIAGGIVNDLAEPEVHTFTVTSGADADGGSFFLNGVEIVVAASATDIQVADAITAAFVADAFNVIPEIADITNEDEVVTVTYTEAAGNVADNFLVFEENPASSGVTFAAALATETAKGVEPVPETQTLVVAAGTIPAGQDILVGGKTITLDGGLNVDEAGQAIADAINADLAGVATALGFNPASVAYAPATNTLTFTFDAADDDVDVIVVDGDPDATANDVFGAAVATIELLAGGAGTDEIQTFTITDGTDANGGNIFIGDQEVALAPDLSEGQVGVAIVDAFVGGQLQTIDGASVLDISLGGTPDVVVITFDRNDGDVTEITVSDDPATSTVAISAVAPTQFVPEDADPDSVLVLDEMASGGAVELTDWVIGQLIVNVADAGLASSTDDELNIKLNGDLSAINTGGIGGNLSVDNVETINIETSTTSKTMLPDDNGWLSLFAPDAETVTLAGNYGLDLMGALNSMTLLDASGVEATESAVDADDAGDVGRVSISWGATDDDVTILTGNGDDWINAWFVGTDPDDTGSAATIESGAGDDHVLGSEGDDTIDLGVGDDIVESSDGEDAITLGDGNDAYQLQNTQHTVINAYDTILDFNANTVGQGASGAADEDGAAALADRDGDVIDLSGFFMGSPDLSVDVFGNASDATTFLANNDFDGELNIALDSSTGLLYIDIADNGIADSVLELAGVTTIDEAAFLA